MTSLAAHHIDINYGSTAILQHLSFTPPVGEVTALIGPNGCGKSTLLKAYANILQPKAGYISLNDQPFSQLNAKFIAQHIGFLPQILSIPEGITVQQLVGYGRSPHNGLWGNLAETDHEHVAKALKRLSIESLTNRYLGDLSGGQRQRAWLAMVIAQDTDIVLLDEPTTYLDINHQVSLLGLMRELSGEGKTVVTVLHDINQACRYADYIAVMKQGEIIASGRPEETINTTLIADVFDVNVLICDDPVSGKPMCLVKDS